MSSSSLVRIAPSSHGCSLPSRLPTSKSMYHLSPSSTSVATVSIMNISGGIRLRCFDRLEFSHHAWNIMANNKSCLSRGLSRHSCSLAHQG